MATEEKFSDFVSQMTILQQYLRTGKHQAGASRSEKRRVLYETTNYFLRSKFNLFTSSVHLWKLCNLESKLVELFKFVSRLVFVFFFFKFFFFSSRYCISIWWWYTWLWYMKAFTKVVVVVERWSTNNKITVTVTVLVYQFQMMSSTTKEAKRSWRER